MFKGCIVFFIKHHHKEKRVTALIHCALCRGFCIAEDFDVQRILLRRGLSCAHAIGRVVQMTSLVVNFNITLRLTRRGILKIPERFFSRKGQVIKTSLIFLKSVIVWEFQMNLYIPFFQI
jgi:hypothetical protein